MIVFEQQERFNPRTGKPAEPDWVKSNNVICDYCGKIINDDDTDNFPDTRLIVKPSGSVEAWFHEDRDCLGKDCGRFDLYEFFEKQSEFHFCAGYNGDNGCESLLMLEWASHYATMPKDIKIVLDEVVQHFGTLDAGEWFPARHFCELFSTARYRVLRKVLKTMKPESLGIIFEE